MDAGKFLTIMTKGRMYLKNNGALQTADKVVNYLKYSRKNKADANHKLAQQICNAESINPDKIKSEILNFSWRPKFSICMPVYNVEEKWLRKCISSVREQYYSEWELCIADDCSTMPEVCRTLKKYEELDQRIHVCYRKNNGHISRATNSAAALATGDYIVLLDNDDELLPISLYEFAKLLQKNPEADVIYTDEDKIDINGNRFEPHFKPDYSPDTLLSYNYISHLTAYRNSFFKMTGGFRVGFEGAQDYDLLLRAEELTDQIFHIPKVLYHWRVLEGSTAFGDDEKSYAYVAGERALYEAVRRRGYHATVRFEKKYLCYYVDFYPALNHMLSVIMVGNLSKQYIKVCEEAIRRSVHVAELNTRVGSTKSSGTEGFLSQRANCAKVMLEFLPASEGIERAIQQASGDILFFIDTNLYPSDNRWLNLMLGEAERPKIGAIGVKILSRNHRILHAGIELSKSEEPVVVGYGKNARDIGYIAKYVTRRNYPRVSGMCVMLRKAIVKDCIEFNKSEIIVKSSNEYCNICLGDVTFQSMDKLC